MLLTVLFVPRSKPGREKGGDQNSAQGREALARLCQTYWLPVYAFVRKRGHSPDRAKDLTQDFFESFLEKNSVTRAVRERGRYRSFLMTRSVTSCGS
jgi:RNA polymerase sigma-70 factor (ECF subfamily)